MRTNRRTLLMTGAAALGVLASGGLATARPAAGIPAVGLGSWITFNVGDDPALRDRCAQVITAFVEEGGGVIDSSPMYGSAQAVIGDGLGRLGHPASVFSADKVWTSADSGPAQISETTRLWGVDRFDLLQVHNLLDWEANLEILFEMKAAGRLGHVGITTSHGRRHRELETVMEHHAIDFVQLTYNILDREVEERLLPLARERGIRVLCNRPFRRGWLPDRLEGKPLPEWAADIAVTTWPQFLLKFIISHPAVSTAIPATSRVDHLRENKSAEHGPMPDAAMRSRMAVHVADL